MTETRNMMDVTFWGVRGTMPTARPDVMRYGGNTSCVQLQCDDLTLMFDAGSGIVPYVRMHRPEHLHILLSHTHVDHILGLCFMESMFDAAFQCDIWAGHLAPDMTVQTAIRQLCSPPIFPVALDDMAATMRFHDHMAGESFVHPDFDARGIVIDTMLLNHPDRATAYRVRYQGRTMCYVTDVEHVRDQLDVALINFIQGADLFIYDSTFDDNQFDQFSGWGHSTWQQAVRLGDAANVKQCALFHHDIMTDDNTLDARQAALDAREGMRVLCAKEGVTLSL